MSPTPLIPKGQPPWLPGRKTPASENRKGAPAHLTEEQLADYHADRLYKLSFRQTIAALTVLTVAAAVVILPFIYMLLISFKASVEVGNGRFVPEEFENFRTGQTAWITLDLPEKELVAISGLTSIPVLSTPTVKSKTTHAPGRLPSGVVSARRLSMEKNSGESSTTRIVLEVPDTSGKLSQGGIAEVFLPAPDQKWLPVEGHVRTRTWVDVTGRLLQDYQRLLNWDKLKEGNWLSWLRSGYPRWYFNSLFVAFTTVAIGVFLDSLAAFAFAKFNFPFKRILFAVLIATLMIPYPVTLVPTFFLFAKLGFYNTYLALIIPGVVSAFGIFLVRQYMETIPDDMLDAARVDGAGDYQVYWNVVLPTARPVLAALAVFRFIFQWNTYLYPLVLTNKDSMKTVQLGIATMEDMHGTVDYSLQMAGSALAVVPILMVYMFMQKHFIAGITMGSAKS